MAPPGCQDSISSCCAVLSRWAPARRERASARWPVSSGRGPPRRGRGMLRAVSGLDRVRLRLDRVRAAVGEIDPVVLDTPALPCAPLGSALGCSVTLKVETLNPVRSFKERGAETVASVARRKGASRVVCASAGNLGQALAYSEPASRLGGHGLRSDERGRHRTTKQCKRASQPWPQTRVRRTRWSSPAARGREPEQVR